MIRYKNFYYDIEIEEAINYLAEKYSLEVEDRNNDYFISCPIHCETEPSLSIEKTQGLVHCFGCGFKGTLGDLFHALGDGEEVFNTEIIRETPRHLKELTSNNKADELLKKIKSEKKENNIPFTEWLEKNKIAINYLKTRNIKVSIMREFNIMYKANNHSVLFPVNNHKGEFQFFASRGINTKIYRYPTGCHKPVYALDKVRMKGSRYLVITEGILDCLRLWSLDIPAVAMNGTGTYSQYWDIQNNFKGNILTAFDNDRAGYIATKRANDFFKDKKEIRNLTIPLYKKDVNELTDTEIFDMMKAR